MLDIGWDNGENSYLRHVAVHTIICRNIRSNLTFVLLLGYWCFFSTVRFRTVCTNSDTFSPLQGHPGQYRPSSRSRFLASVSCRSLSCMLRKV